MSELVSKYPTAGGIYWWAAKMGGPVWGWFTGWFNLVGLVGVVASVQYACATFMNSLFGYFELNFIFNFADDKHILSETFAIFVVILIVSALINIFSTHLLALVNSVSVGVHVLGVAVIIGILVLVPDHHQSFDFVFTERLNNSGFGNGGMYWFYVLPLGFLLTQYTITGFDASAHVSEETKGASVSAAKGVWRSIFYSAIIGWLVLLAITFAATDVGAVNDGGGGSLAVFDSSLTLTATKVIVLISTIGQLFCGVACLTSASRMCFAFSRDKGLPGSNTLSKVNKDGVPVAAVITMATAALIITLPALEGDGAFPYAFFAVVSITVIGLYIAYVIPTFLRLRAGDAFQPGPWNLGKWSKPVGTIAVVWVVFICIMLMMPQFAPAGGKLIDYLNYAPIAVAIVIGFAGIYWMVSARKWFKGPKVMGTPDELKAIERDLELESS
jgi:amino acid transporter